MIETEMSPTPKRIQLPDFTHPETHEIVHFGTVEVMKGINSEGCVDPRQSVTFIQPDSEVAEAMQQHLNYNPNILRPPHHDGSERSPGATFGKAMTLAGAVPDISPEQAVDLVTQWEESEGRRFTLHEDDHTHTHGLGCGHADRASQEENETLYGLSPDKVLAMREYVLQKTQQGEMTAEAPVLTNRHKEKGVLVVLSDRETVSATDGTNEFFRFDATRHDESLERLAAFAQTKGIEVTADKLKATAETQRNATLQLLAAGLPIYEIDLRGQEPTVVFKGTVRPIFPISNPGVK